MMKHNQIRKLIILLFALPALACGLFTGEEPTPTPEPQPTATTEPSPTAAPTDTPEPSPTPSPEASPTSDVSAEFVSFASEELGLAIQHPADWAIQDFAVLLLASNEEILADPDNVGDGAVMVVAGDSTESLGSTDPVVLVEQSVEEFGLSEDAAIVDGPTATTIQGQDAAIARIEGTSDETGEARVGLVAVIINGDWAAVSLGYTTEEFEAQYLPLIEAMMNTIVVSEPLESDPGTADGPPTLEGSTPLAVGDQASGSLVEGSPQDFVVSGQTNSPVTIVVEPQDDNLDLVLEVFDTESNNVLRVDEGLSGEPEEAVFTPAADGDYFVRVSDFFGAPGGFDLSITAGGEVVPAEQTRLESSQIVQGRIEGEPIGYVVSGTAGQPTTVLLLPEENLDATLTVLSPEGAVLVQQVDDGFSGEAEAITYTPTADGDLVVEVDAFSTGEGGFSIFLVNPATAFTAEGTVADDGSQSYQVCVPANASIVVFVDPEDDFDIVVSINGPGGEVLADEIDNGFSGEPEAVFLTETADPNAAYPVIVEVSGFGGQAGNFSITVGASSPEGLVLDGC